MKRVFSFLLLLMILFLGIEFLVTMFTKEYIVNYVVMINDKKSDENRIASPYTMPTSTKGKAISIIIVALFLVIID